MTTEEAYQILGLGRQATAAQVKAAYRRRALEWHPDRYQDDDEKDHFAEKFLRARDAYEQLRREGFPELKDEPAPEPDFAPRVAGRSFAPDRREPASVSETLGLGVRWNLGAAFLWGVVMPGGVAILGWFCRYLLRQMGR